jgi:hypothetical protein
LKLSVGTDSPEAAHVLDGVTRANVSIGAETAHAPHSVLHRDLLISADSPERPNVPLGVVLANLSSRILAPETEYRLYLIWQSSENAKRPLRLWHLKMWSRKAAMQVLQALSRDDVVYVSLSWYSADSFSVNWLYDTASRVRCEVVVLANARDEFDALFARGVRTIHVSHNAFIDESLFALDDTIPESARPYDLFVNSRFDPFKRVELAAGVSKAAFMGYNGRFCVRTKGDCSTQRYVRHVFAAYCIHLQWTRALLPPNQSSTVPSTTEMAR